MTDNKDNPVLVFGCKGDEEPRVIRTAEEWAELFGQPCPPEYLQQIGQIVLTKDEPDDDLSELDRRMYTAGRNRAWMIMLDECLNHLGHENAATMDRVSWVSERCEAIAALRDVCNMHGDNDWQDSDHLCDIISKHLESWLGDDS